MISDGGNAPRKKEKQRKKCLITFFIFALSCQNIFPSVSEMMFTLIASQLLIRKPFDKKFHSIVKQKKLHLGRYLEQNSLNKKFSIPSMFPYYELTVLK
ncbi:CLUMA_CG018356, isoform A [Clunio marinus]|uniref:CLUMA_CG018356, isoform A n=1 Tax=Clunio marinus TaxID=568069 RepID=A0A1J1J085_9DIPT|nr:CLUMA_CG018356, isoform A [Clunio marinus]